MSDTALVKFLQYGTAAERGAFTPDPAPGLQTLNLWLDTDNLPTIELYIWDPDAMGWELVNGSGALADGDYGDVTVSSSGTVITIDNDAVTYAKLQNVSATDRLLGRDTAGAGNTEEIPVSSGLAFTDGPGLIVTAAVRTRSVVLVVDGGGSAITTGVKGDIQIPVAGTITAVRMLADQSGSAVVDIWKDSYANFPPTVADTITASAKPTLSAAANSEDTTLTGWTTSVSAGDILRFNVDSAATITRLTLELTVVVTG